MDQPALVIGGCGFLGSHIVEQLLSSDKKSVHVLDVRTSNNRFSGATYHEGDLSSPESLLDVLERVNPAVIYHTASPALGNQKITELLYRVNVDGTQNILRCCAQVPSVKALVYTSSASICLDGRNSFYNVDESYPVFTQPMQKDEYAHTKALAETKVLGANRSKEYNGLLTCAIRPSGVFGERDEKGMIPGLIKVYQEGNTNKQIGDNTILFDIAYVGNVAHAHILAAERLLATASLSTAPLDHEKVDGEAFFITNDTPMPFWDWSRAIWGKLGDKTRIKDVWVIPTGLGLFLATVMEWIYWIVFLGKKVPTMNRQSIQYVVLNRTFRIEKARRRLGYEPRVDTEEAIRRTLEWHAKRAREAEKLSEKEK